MPRFCVDPRGSQSVQFFSHWGSGNIVPASTIVNNFMFCMFDASEQIRKYFWLLVVTQSFSRHPPHQTRHSDMMFYVV